MTANILGKFVFAFLILLVSNSLYSQQYLEFLSDVDLTYDQKVEMAETHFDTKGRGKHTGYKQFLRWKYFAKRNLTQDRYVITEEQNINEYMKFIEKNGGANKKSSGTWIEKGPLSATNTSTWSSHIGRLSNIGIDPNDDTHMIVTSLGGGVWKTTDEGANWIPIFDQENTMSLQSAMISHANSAHYFVGTSGGIRKSTDGGANWSSSSGVSGTIYSIIMDPNNANNIYASSSNGRVYRSTDGGSTWNSTLLETSRRFYDLDFKPGSSTTLYACGTAGAMYSSTDSGVTWTSINGPWNSTRTIMFAVTPHDSDYIYVLQESGGGFGGLYLSADGGTNWTTQSAYDGTNNIMGYNLNQTGGQAPRDMDIIVSPTDKTEVHVAGVMTFRSNDSGVNWTQTTSWLLSSSLAFVHADIDQLIYHGSKIYVASDGGIFISTDQANTFTDKTTGLGIRQFYRISASTTEVGRVAGGSQDNGTGILRNGVWYDFMGADGMEPCILNNDDDVVIGSIQYGQLNKSNNAGNSLSSISQTQGGQNAEWVTPLERDPVAGNTIYQGKKYLYKSINAGGSWTTISDTIPAGVNTNMDEICIAPSNNNVIVIAYSKELLKTTNGGISWDSITPPATLSNNINYISIHPTNPDRIALATSGGTRFLESTDGGANWTDIKYNLPNSGSSSIIYDGRAEDGIYVSMSKGVYYKDSSSPTSWTLMDAGLPKVSITELELVNDKLYASTYGRGLWELTVPGKGWTMSANYELLDCISQGTVDSLDDHFTFLMNPTGMGLGTTYSVSGDITQANIPYGTAYTFDNGGSGYPKHNGPLSLTITDDSNANTTISFKVHANIKENCYNNSTCDDAFVIYGDSTILCAGPYIGSGATNPGRSAAWYKFTAPADGAITVRSCGSGEDTNLLFHSGYCSFKTLVASSDDACEMGPGLNNYASEIVDVPINRNETYFIEWDSRWSSDPFTFTVEFKPECTDMILADVTSMDEATFSAEDLIDLDGIATGNITAISETGNIQIENLTVNNLSSLIVMKEDCEVNVFSDALIIAGNNTAIPDNGSIDINFEFPASLTETISDFTFGYDITHPDISELKMELISPQGDKYVLWNNSCPGESDLHLVYDLKAQFANLCDPLWQSGESLFTEGLLFGNELQSLYSKAMAGTWKIRIADNSAGNIGTINQLHVYFKAD